MTSQFPLIAPAEALRIVLQVVPAPAAETRSLLDAVGLRLAEDIRADRDYPPFDRAMMDGYAVRCADAAAGTPLRIVGQLAAGQASPSPLEPGQCVEIMTGAACPRGTDAVVPRECVVRDGDRVTLPTQLERHQHLAVRGSECRAGDRVLHSGALITPIAVGILASVGRHDVRVFAPPRVGIITTGGELIERSRMPAATQIRDSNAPMLAAMLLGCGLTAATPTIHARDDMRDIRAALDRMQACDLVLLTGGVSTGVFDLVPESLRQSGAEILFHKVAQKPGKPLLFARRARQLFFGLPGNPLAVHLGFHRYVAAAMRRWCGHSEPSPERPLGRLLEPVRPVATRTWFVLAKATGNQSAARIWNVQLLPGISSADLFSTRQANCYLEVPPGVESLPVGECVPLEWLTCPDNAWQHDDGCRQ